RWRAHRGYASGKERWPCPDQHLARTREQLDRQLGRGRHLAGRPVADVEAPAGVAGVAGAVRAAVVLAAAEAGARPAFAAAAAAPDRRFPLRRRLTGFAGAYPVRECSGI